MKYSLCDGWEFTSQWNDEFLAGAGAAQSVRLPHTCKELPMHCVDPADYQMLCGYRRTLDIPPELKNKRLFFQLDGAAHIATVYVNGAEAAVHRCGYTAFRVELTGLVEPGIHASPVSLTGLPPASLQRKECFPSAENFSFSNCASYSATPLYGLPSPIHPPRCASLDNCPMK